MRDTNPKIAEKVGEMIRAKLPIERLMMGSSMYETSKYLVTQAILRMNPTISKSEMRQEIFLKFYGQDFTPEEREKILRHLAKAEG